ncbi:MAG: membrane associated rhomboid family serine protease [Oceanospirillaceae bacterium]|jgi:membrane associated rhomboid family serine protease
MSHATTALSFKQQIKIVFALSLMLAILEVINIVTARALNQFGLIPRQLTGLIGIFSAPLLHGSLWHFFSNIIPFALFSFLLLQHGTKRYLQVTLICTVVSGLLVWLFARSAIHVGASGLIYGYFGYLVLAGFLSKKLKLILISLFVGLSYGTLVFGILPVSRYISWESHLFGLIVGLLCAYWIHKRK